MNRLKWLTILAVSGCLVSGAAPQAGEHPNNEHPTAPAKTTGNARGPMDHQVAGSLKPGDAAPDLNLLVLKSAAGLDKAAVEKLQTAPEDAKTVEGGKAAPEHLKLSSFKGKRPVVLLFGSYT